MVALFCTLSAQNFYVATNKSIFSWLKLFEVCKNSLESDDKFNSNDMNHFWQRCFLMFELGKWTIRLYFLLGIGLIAYIFNYIWPRELLIPLGIAWPIVYSIWLYYLISIQIGLVPVFNQLCHYLILRFDKLNVSLKRLRAPNSHADDKTRIECVNDFMKDHNKLCSQVYSFNKFWKYHIFFSFIIYIGIVAFFFNLIFLVKTSYWVKFSLGIVSLCIFLFLCVSILSAGLVPEYVSTINSINHN